MLIEAMRHLGLDVYLLNGGIQTPDIPGGNHVVQLPALRALDQQFAVLVDADGNQIDTPWKENRCRILLDQFRSLRPDIVVIESFPFGRRQLRFELIPLLEEIKRVRPRPLVVCSVRDIVQERPQKRLDETVDILRRYFDLVMVHGDPALVRFDQSFKDAARISDRLHYTGYVSQPLDQCDSKLGLNEVIVSAGGGAVSQPLLTAALKARQYSRFKDVNWRILVGPNTPPQVIEHLNTSPNDGGVVIEPNRQDFLTLLCNCFVSVSQAGYNTVMDVLRTGVRAVLVPFEGEGETEQRLRAQKLQQLGIAEVVIESTLSPPTIAEAVDRSASKSPPQPNRFNLDGAAGAAQFVLDSWYKHTTTVSEQ